MQVSLCVPCSKSFHFRFWLLESAYSCFIWVGGISSSRIPARNKIGMLGRILPIMSLVDQIWLHRNEKGLIKGITLKVLANTPLALNVELLWNKWWDTQKCVLQYNCRDLHAISSYNTQYKPLLGSAGLQQDLLRLRHLAIDHIKWSVDLWYHHVRVGSQVQLDYRSWSPFQ